MSTLMNDARAIALIAARLPADKGELMGVQLHDHRYVPSAVRRYIKAEALRVATAMNGRVDQGIFWDYKRHEITRLNAEAIASRLEESA